jgi:pimeloyl-ACP methyl ester carboxylesterase
VTTTDPTVVLVHGAFTDASIWHPAIADLQRRGHRVLAPAMPMRSLAGDTAHLRATLAAVEGPVVLVGHSWGGSVISDPRALTSAVRALVFVAAFQPDSGDTAADLNYRFPGSRLTPETTAVHPTPAGDDMLLRPEHFAAVYAADVDPVTAAVMAAAQHPIDPAALGESFTGAATWRALPSWALLADADRSVPVQAQRFMADRARSTVTTVPSSHAVPVAHPRETTAVIAEAVAAVFATTGEP